MAGLVPAIHVFSRTPARKTWMPATIPGSSPGDGHDAADDSVSSGMRTTSTGASFHFVDGQYDGRPERPLWRFAEAVH